ncbi:hypothetical protein F4826_001067 [Rahnella inusitata]|nr:hypothetical protein ASE99_03200 [Serratia sp. Leaf51]MBB6114189.1 hypothetical protein [Rahnella inusitata]
MGGNDSCGTHSTIQAILSTKSEFSVSALSACYSHSVKAPELTGKVSVNYAIIQVNNRVYMH